MVNSNSISDISKYLILCRFKSKKLIVERIWILFSAFMLRQRRRNMVMLWFAHFNINTPGREITRSALPNYVFGRMWNIHPTASGRPKLVAFLNTSQNEQDNFRASVCSDLRFGRVCVFFSAKDVEKYVVETVLS